ncbi:MAG: hypothetical protein NZ108_07635, partial [Bacteroidia bacterium]|nr:hypothetical protein [Bacteroidia bacterium]
RLREITLSYYWKPNIKKIIGGLDFSITGRNLALYTPYYKGIDPETSLVGAGSNARGIEYFNMPNTRSFIFTLRVDFK